MNFKKKCLFCGRSCTAANYKCNCKNEDWSFQYRNVDIEINLENTQPLLDSFYNYSFDDAKGILQYKGLPIHSSDPVQAGRVGLTPLYKLRTLGNRYGCTMYLKDEGTNPSGCFKDRESLLCLLNSIHNQLQKAVIYSSVNAAASAVTLAANSNYYILIFTSGDTPDDKIDFIRNHGSDVVVIGDEHTTFEEGHRLLSSINAKKLFQNEGFDNWSVQNPYRVQGDKTTALELIKQLSPDGGKTVVVPDYVLIPTANGSGLAGIWKGFKELRTLGIISRLPRMVATGIRRGNPVCEAVQRMETGAPVRCSRSQVDPEDMETGSMLVVEEGYDSPEAAKAVIESGGTAIELHTKELRETLIHFLDGEKSLAIEHSILPEPAALVSMAAVKKLSGELGLSQADVVVSISTGHGFRAMKLINRLLIDRIDLQYMVNHIATDKRNKMKVTAPRKGEVIRAEADEQEVIRSFSQLAKSVV